MFVTAATNNVYFFLSRQRFFQVVKASITAFIAACESVYYINFIRLSKCLFLRFKPFAKAFITAFYPFCKSIFSRLSKRQLQHFWWFVKVFI